MVACPPIALHSMCQLYVDASVKSDMAKRIMLSVIPGVMTEGEKHHSGGFDYKALRSAVNGANDLIKYGTRACVGELQHAVYGPADEYYDENVGIPLNAAKSEAPQYLASGEYIECLKLCIRIFDNPEYWTSHQFGGQAWSKIAKVLKDLAIHKKRLNTLRLEASSPNREKGIDYLSAEISIMKEMVVLMNVFDGLAHNTASIMYNIVEEEMKDLGVKELKDESFSLRHPLNEEQAKSYPSQYMQSILNMMDAKELDNPLAVYNEVKSEIEQPEHKYMFEDYIRRVKEHPEYKTEDNTEKLKRIRVKKGLIEPMKFIISEMNNIASAKDNLINAKTDKNIRDISQKIRSGAFTIRTIIQRGVLDAIYGLGTVLKVIDMPVYKTCFDVIGVCNQYVQLFTRNGTPSVTDTTNMMNDLKRQIGTLEREISEL
jgi:hypothetical protein